MKFLKFSTLAAAVFSALVTLTFAQETPVSPATDSVLDEVLGNPAVPFETKPAPVAKIPPMVPDVRPMIERAEKSIGSGTEATVVEKERTAASEPKGESWRQRYELGAGDVLNFGLSGKPKLIALAVPVAPDGTISYLQAKRVSVIGRTIGELRIEMEKILSNYHRSPRMIITPAKLGSKKYTIMGQVVENGSYPLERPTNLIEAIAKSKGIAVGINDDSAMELADFDRSFIVRKNQKLEVDFASLYLKGDLTQNVNIEPGDYIYIASRLNNEFYVFGEVSSPGLKLLTGDFTVTGAIASAQGFGPKAWKSHVLIVRGSLGSPELIKISMGDILHGEAPDVPIQRGDIIYVHRRPWSLAEDLTDVAIKAFLSGVVAGAIDPERVSVGIGG